MAMRADPRLRGLSERVGGEVLAPGDDAYDDARGTPVARFAGLRPRAIVRCASTADVAATLAFARASGLPLAVRSGGHCFAGRSSSDGVVLDVRPLRVIAAAQDTVTVGAGARLGEIYDALDPHGLTIAAGCGPTVGISGLALGGGLGILGRRHGLTCDQLLAARVVLADGSVVDCDATDHPDLFWGLQGAGGCRFGVVTRLVLRTLPAPLTTTLHLRWPFEQAAPVLDAWQRWSPDAPAEVAASLLLTAGADPATEPVVHVFGAVVGPRGAAAAQVADLVARAGAEPASADLRQLSYRDAKRHLVATGPGEVPASAHAFVKSEFFRAPMPADVIGALVAEFAAGRVAGEHRSLDFSPWGGAYVRLHDDATAFAHRAERFLLKHEAAVAPGHTPGPWLQRSWQLVHPWGSGGVYPNFPDPELASPDAAYLGVNLQRVRRVAAAYDPDGLFAAA